MKLISGRTYFIPGFCVFSLHRTSFGVPHSIRYTTSPTVPWEQPPAIDIISDTAIFIVVYWAVHPPSMIKVDPVKKLASSLAR